MSCLGHGQITSRVQQRNRRWTVRSAQGTVRAVLAMPSAIKIAMRSHHRRATRAT